jgi:hydrogenase expression/formation protein HypC
MRTARVAFGGVVKEVCLAYVPEAEVGDYVIVHVGFALSRLDEAEAARVFEALAGLELEEGGAHGRPEGGAAGGVAAAGGATGYGRPEGGDACEAAPAGSAACEAAPAGSAACEAAPAGSAAHEAAPAGSAAHGRSA